MSESKTVTVETLRRIIADYDSAPPEEWLQRTFAALPAAPEPPALIDVERLARAIESGPAMYWKHRELADGSTEAVLDAERYARDLAAAYEAME